MADERVMSSVRRCRYIASEETGGAYRLGTSAPSLHEDKRGGGKTNRRQYINPEALMKIAQLTSQDLVQVLVELEPVRQEAEEEEERHTQRWSTSILSVKLSTHPTPLVRGQRNLSQR